MTAHSQIKSTIKDMVGVVQNLADSINLFDHASETAMNATNAMVSTLDRQPARWATGVFSTVFFLHVLQLTGTMLTSAVDMANATTSKRNRVGKFSAGAIRITLAGVAAVSEVYLVINKFIPIAVNSLSSLMMVTNAFVGLLSVFNVIKFVTNIFEALRKEYSPNFFIDNRLKKINNLLERGSLWEDKKNDKGEIIKKADPRLTRLLNQAFAYYVSYVAKEKEIDITDIEELKQGFYDYIKPSLLKNSNICAYINSKKEKNKPQIEQPIEFPPNSTPNQKMPATPGLETETETETNTEIGTIPKKAKEIFSDELTLGVDQAKSLGHFLHEKQKKKAHHMLPHLVMYSLSAVGSGLIMVAPLCPVLLPVGVGVLTASALIGVGILLKETALPALKWALAILPKARNEEDKRQTIAEVLNSQPKPKEKDSQVFNFASNQQVHEVLGDKDQERILRQSYKQQSFFNLFKKRFSEDEKQNDVVQSAPRTT